VLCVELRNCAWLKHYGQKSQVTLLSVFLDVAEEMPLVSECVRLLKVPKQALP
jgi:hypothetical protein